MTPEVQIVSASSFLSAAARGYGLRQLSRRAGVSHDWFATWRIEHDEHETLVYPVVTSSKRIRFPHAAPAHWDNVRAGMLAVARFEYPEMDADIPDIVVPYAESTETGRIFQATEEEVTFCADVLASLVLTLSRYEETLPAPRDCHDRFPASASLAAKYGFMERPIVDEMGLAFEQALRRLFPVWQAAPREMRLNITHDADEIGVPFRLRTAARRARQCGIATGLQEVLRLGKPRALTAVRETVLRARRRGLTCSVYVKAADRSEFDSGYDIRRRDVAEEFIRARAAGAELGVHPGYDTWLEPERLAEEVERVGNTFGRDATLSGRQHFLRWSPQSWLDWEDCGLRCDSSVGFSEQPGFRAGTAYAYRPWLFAQDREADLLEVPLIAMDCSLTGSLRMRGKQCLHPLLTCLERCERVGGVFTLLWHTDSILDPVYGDSYDVLLDKLAAFPPFHWQQDFQDRYA